MTVALCLPSRGRPELLRACIHNAMKNSEVETTRIVVGLDTDDHDSLHLVELLKDQPKIQVSVCERENSLGEKYNRCAAMVPADVYVLWSDDVCFASKGWDTKIIEMACMYDDSIGAVYFGEIPGVFQPGIAVTDEFVKHMGFLSPPFFPFWWQDTWIDEISAMTGRILRADISVACSQGLQKQSRGVLEIDFWAKVFDDTRPMRIKAANSIIDAGHDKLWRKIQLRQNIPQVASALAQRNSILRDPFHARRLEKHYSFDAPADERYYRLKAAAENMMASLAA